MMGSVYIKGIPENLKAKFKAVCAFRGVSIKDRFIKMMEQDVADFETTQAFAEGVRDDSDTTKRTTKRTQGGGRSRRTPSRAG